MEKAEIGSLLMFSHYIFKNNVLILKNKDKLKNSQSMTASSPSKKSLETALDKISAQSLNRYSSLRRCLR